LLLAAGGAAALACLPKNLLAAARNEITAVRTGIQPGNKTRLVVETTRRPEFSLSYPDGKLAISIDAADNKAKPVLLAGTLISAIDFQDNRIILSLKKAIPPVPQEQIMVLAPAGGNNWRLVVDFSAGAPASAAATPQDNRTAKERKPIIVIDPGHGAGDPGCIGATGTYEKNIVLSVATKLYDKLLMAGYDAHLTRKNDIFLNLGTRASIAEKKKADLFVSIHANANPSRMVKGFSVFTLSDTASDAEAQKLADAENAADRIDVDGFQKLDPATRIILSSLQQKRVAEESVDFAGKIISAVGNAKIERMDAKIRSAGFAVLKSTVPSCLVEIGHLSNKDEEKLLRDAAYQNRLASALVSAIGNYEFVN